MSSTSTSKPTLVMGRAPPPPTAAAAATRDVHSIPCKTSYTGPAPVEGYLMREKREDGKERTALRGRRLEGIRMDLPEGYECRLIVDKGMGRLEPESLQSYIMWWEHDREPNERSCLHRAISHLPLAAALAAEEKEQ